MKDRGRRRLERAVEALRGVERLGVCPACLEPISRHQKTEQIAGKTHHQRCARYVPRGVD